MRWVSSSCTRNTSPTGVCVAWDHSRVPVDASVSCVVTRISSPARSSVPVTITSTSASAAIFRESAASPDEARRREAGAHDQRFESAERSSSARPAG